MSLVYPGLAALAGFGIAFVAGRALLVMLLDVAAAREKPGSKEQGA
jgi:hypothetical protein